MMLGSFKLETHAFQIRNNDIIIIIIINFSLFSFILELLLFESWISHIDPSRIDQIFIYLDSSIFNVFGFTFSKYIFNIIFQNYIQFVYMRNHFYFSKVLFYSYLLIFNSLLSFHRYNTFFCLQGNWSEFWCFFIFPALPLFLSNSFSSLWLFSSLSLKEGLS